MSNGILSRLLAALRPRRASRPAESHRATDSVGTGSTGTVEVARPEKARVRIQYRPQRDGEPDGGEIVWTWVPYQEDAQQGKDRPVLVIGRHDADRVYAVKLTSRAHDGERDYLPVGSGSWDSRGRESWVDIDQLYLVHHDGMRREAASLERARFDRVAQALHRRYGWPEPA